MQELIIEILNKYGYIGVLLLIMIENIFPPIPSEIILTFSGFMTTQSDMNIWIVILAATAGSVIGAIILYLIGRMLNTERLERLFDSKLGGLLHLRKEDVRRAERWFLQRGNKAVFFCRFVPIVRSLISIPAGVAEMKLSSFTLLTVVGTFIWNTVLVFLGEIAGNAWGTIAHYVDIYSMIVIAVLAFVAVAVGIFFIKRRFLDTRNDNIDNNDNNENIDSEKTDVNQDEEDK